MAGVTHTKIDAMDAIDGALPGIKFHKAAEHVARVGPEVKRKVTPGPDGIRLLVIGATPGAPYETGGTL